MHSFELKTNGSCLLVWIIVFTVEVPTGILSTKKVYCFELITDGSCLLVWVLVCLIYDPIS
jgi:hypothetical protein